MRRTFKLPSIEPFTLVRVDADEWTDTPADIRTVEGYLVIPGSVLRAGPDGDLPDVLGPDDDDVPSPVLTLYLKVLSANVGLSIAQSQVPDEEATYGAGAAASVLSGAAGSGMVYVNGQLAVLLSADPDNTATYGTDAGLYIPPASGGGTGGTGYRFHQVTPQTVWTITHGLGYDPAGVVVIATDGWLLDGYGLQFLVPGDSLRIAMDIAYSGTAYLS